MREIRFFVVTLAALTLGVGCQQDRGEYPSFMLGSADNPGSGDIDVIQDIGTNTAVQGRFLASQQYRGFTFEAQQGEEVTIQLQAELEDDGFLTGQRVATQILLFAQSEGAPVFEQVIQDSGMVEQAVVQADIEQSGTYLIAIARQDDVAAQFQLDVECPECQQGPPEPDKLCEPGRLYVEGYNQRSQEWNRCEVILLEPAELLAEETLRIGPDVNVRAHYYITDYHPEGFGETKLTISGDLVMESDPEHPVVFESNVPGRQWAGIEIASRGVSIHDFLLRDTYEGLRIAAHEVEVRGGTFTLNRVGVDIIEILESGTTTCPSDAIVSESTFRENDTGLNISCQRTTDGLTIRDSEVALNDIGLSLARLNGALLSGLDVHDNDDGVRIFNFATQDEPPENDVILDSSIFKNNTRALTLEGNGQVTDSEFRDNGEYGVLFDRTTRRFGNRTTWNAPGWTQLRNSLVARNGSDCQWSDEDFDGSFTSDLTCGGVIVQRGVHAVIRNDIVRDNDGFGVVLRGETGVESQVAGGGGDPSVLNSVIESNARGGIFLVDSPIYSIEYNVIQDNGRTALQLGYTSGMGGTRSYRDPETNENSYYFWLRNNRFEHNNVYAASDLFIFTTQNTRYSYIPPVEGPRLVMTNNYFDGMSAEEVEALLAFPHADIAPVMTSPEQMAGLIRPLDFE